MVGLDSSESIIYLVYGGHRILITTEETQPLRTPRGQLSAWLIDARSLLSITALSQLLGLRLNYLPMGSFTHGDAEGQKEEG